MNDESSLLVWESPDMLYNHAQLKLAAEEEHVRRITTKNNFLKKI